MDTTEEPFDGSWQGVTVTARGDLRLSDLKLRFDPDTGEVSMEGPRVWLRSDVWPSWLMVAATHLDTAFKARLRNEGPNTDSFDGALGEEFRAAMTSLCASAFALEAFASSVHHHVPASKVGGRSADARIHQTLHRSFRLSNDTSKEVRRVMQQVFRFRDSAVHPSAAFAEAVGHPAFRTGMEPRMVVFRVENAAAAYRLAFYVITHCLSHPRPLGDEFAAWCEVMLEQVTQTVTTPENVEGQ